MCPHLEHGGGLLDAWAAEATSFPFEATGCKTCLRAPALGHTARHAPASNPDSQPYSKDQQGPAPLARAHTNLAVERASPHTDSHGRQAPLEPGSSSDLCFLQSPSLSASLPPRSGKPCRHATASPHPQPHAFPPGHRNSKPTPALAPVCGSLLVNQRAGSGVHSTAPASSMWLAGSDAARWLLASGLCAP